MEKQTTKQSFLTGDVWLAAFLNYYGIAPILQDNNGRVIFAFPATDAVYRLAADYNSGAQVPLLAYSEIHKALKGQMFAARGGVK